MDNARRWRIARLPPKMVVALVEPLVPGRGGARTRVATGGRAAVSPGALNVIPDEARFTLDIRAPDDAVRAALVAEIVAGCAAIAERRGVSFERGPLHGPGGHPPWTRR